jgi:hypothetical protein
MQANAFVDFCWRIRYLLWGLLAITTAHFIYTLWSGTNLFLRVGFEFWFGLACGLTLWALAYFIKITVTPRKPE